MRIAVVDDERPARSELIFLLSSILPEAEILEADSARSARELLTAHQFQVCFLDINLGEVKGTTLASVIRQWQPDAGIVFVTAYQDYAVEAFDLDAVDYVMKPFDLKRLTKTIEKLKNQGYLGKTDAPKEVFEKKESSQGTDKVAVNGGDRIKLIPADSIVMIEARRRGCRICTSSECFEETTTLNQWEEKLHDRGFFRVHKSFLVNLNYLEEMVPSYNSGYSIRMQYLTGELVPVGRTKLKELKELFTI